MSPEQCRGNPASPRSDQYALGVLAYEMLAGHLPFAGTDAAKVVQQHLTETPPPLARGRTDIPPRLEAAVLRALSKVPEMRFGSAGAFASEFAAACREASDKDVPVGVSKSTSPVSAPVSLVDGVSMAPLPGSARNPYVVATRGGRSGGRRTALVFFVLLLLVGGLGAAAYYLLPQMNAKLAAAKPVARKMTKPRKGASERGKRSARRSGGGSDTGSWQLRSDPEVQCPHDDSDKEATQSGLPAESPSESTPEEKTDQAEREKPEESPHTEGPET
jgi:serine/threonine protein kinase